MESVDLDKPIDFNPYQLSTFLKDFGVKLHSAAMVIDALRQNYTTVSMAAHMALSDGYTRQCVESFLDGKRKKKGLLDTPRLWRGNDNEKENV
tara:strand:+ start:195 stop:473 length:279 start_codon:yes stop_codon:yes gene_type:complete